MIHRHRSAVLVAVVGLSLGISANVLAQEDASPTAAQLLSQGMTQYQQGDLAGARQTLERVDSAQLDKQARVDLTRTLQDIDRQAALQNDPAALLAEAAKAVNAGDLQAAGNHYQQVVGLPDASSSQKQLARARLAQIRRQTLPADERAARQNLNQAVQDMADNRLDAAQQKLQAVRDSGVDLGWFDNQRLDRALAVIAERRAAVAQMTPPEPAPEPVAQVETPAGQAAVQTTPADEAAAPAAAAVAQQAARNNQANQDNIDTAQATAQQPAAEAPAGEAAQPESDVLAQAMSLAAQEKIAQARQAQGEGNHRLAVQYYEQALQIQPANAEARQGLDDAQTRLQQANARQNPSVIQQQISGMDLRGQAAIAEYRQLRNLAENQRKALNHSVALETIGQAKIILDNNSQYLPAAEYRRLRDEANQLTARINDEKIRFDQQQQERLAREQEEKTRQAAIIAAQTQDMEVQNLLRRAQALRKEQNYDRALQLVNQALFLAPNNFAAQAMKDIIEDSIVLTRFHKITRERDLKTAKHRLDNYEATIPPTELLIYPPDWPQLSQRRLEAMGQDGADSEANRVVAQKLREPIPAEFNANQLETAINFIRQITGVNILVKWSVMQQVGVERDTPISLQLSNVPASQALKYILQDASSRVGSSANPITFAIFDGLVHVSTEEDLKSTTTYARVYDIRDLLIQVPNFEDAPDFELSSVLESSEGVGGGSGGGGRSSSNLFGDSDSDSEDEGEDRAALIQQITDLIQSTVGKPEDWPNAGGLLSSITELNGNLIIRTTPNNHRATIELLSQLRETRAMQISIEARFLLVDRQFVNDFGVDFDITFNNLGGNWGPVTIAQESFPATNIASALTGGNPALSLGASFMDDVEVNLMIRATQADQRSVQLTAPRLTLFNGQRAYVLISTQTTFISDLEPVPDAGGFNPTVSVVNEGVMLDVEGTVSADRRYVTMTVRPSLARLVDLVSVPFYAATADTINNNNNNNNNNDGNIIVSQGELQLPILEVNTIRTTVSVPDKGTILLGGQRIVNEREIEVGVPVLSKIPVINRLFTNRSIDKLDRTLLILIKPTIIIQAEEEENLFPGLNADPQQFNVGRTFD